MMLAETDGAFEERRPVLEARSVSKSFAGVVANDNVDFSLKQGEIHALLGENGAGKSTLASILSGLYDVDKGQLLVHGIPVQLRSPGDALGRGIGMVHQHFHLVERFSVAENVVLGDPRQSLFLSRRQIAMVSSLGERYGLKLDAEATTGNLSMGERQRVEIVKMLYRKVDVLLLDEPTAVLTAQETEALFRTLRDMAKDGKSIVLITHKLDEVMSVADRATVMRNGLVVGTVMIADTSASELARLMIGRDVVSSTRRSSGEPGKPILVAQALALPGPHPPSDINLAVRAGEIVGVAGIAGNGQLQLAETLAGLREPLSGTVHVNGIALAGKGPRAARAAGLAYVPQDRLGTGLAPQLSILDNLLLTKELPFLLSSRKYESAAAGSIAAFNISARSPRDVTGRLSGGNVQKVLLARELAAGANVLIVASPTRGLDISATQFVRDLLYAERGAGAAVLLISEDLDEIRDLADRIVVMQAGRFVLERRAADCDLTELGLAMAGGTVTRH